MRQLNVIALLVCLWNLSSSEVIVETNRGPIRSTAARSDDVEAFLGVPYAEPPIGDLRFAKPVEKQPWTEIYDASNLPPPCMQLHLNATIYYVPSVEEINRMSEDCLYLNIWTPKAKPEGDLRPVVIYIHPGSYSHGSSIQKSLDGSHLASKGDVVVVTLNYRLGSLGFLLANIEEADGNMAVYDQLMAMKWVKDNAKHFGGDPENIVLMATSGGAWYAGIHMVSPLSKNLFRRAIFQSGAVINPLIYDGNERLFKNSAFIASVAGCTSETATLESDPRSVVECLKGKTKEALMEAEIALLSKDALMFWPRSGDQILPEEAAAMYLEGKFRQDVDVMCGTSKNDGGLLLVGALHGFIGVDGTIPSNFKKSRVTVIARLLASVSGISNPSELVSYYQNIIEDSTTEGHMKALSYTVGDYAVTCSVVFLADLISRKGNKVYYYKFGFRSPSTPMVEWVDVTHLDDVQYVFGNPYHKDFTAEEKELSDRLITRISSFARTGDPNGPGLTDWKTYSHSNPVFLYIDQEGESIQSNPHDRCNFWRKDFKSDTEPDLMRYLRNTGKNSAA